MLEEILKIMPDNIAIQLAKIGGNKGINEIRLRINRKVIVIVSGVEVFLDVTVTLKDLLDILVRVSKNSIYAIQNDINNGFVVILGGHRIGICGEVVMQDGKIKNIKNINSMNIRVARQLIGAADKVMPYIISQGKIKNTLIISPPGCGKTTMLRDIVRQVSNGVKELGFYGKNVGLVDERGEIASVSNGIPNLDIGLRTDVISNCSKSLGIEMMVRSMGINVIATDEIGSKGDIAAIRYAVLSGVSLLFTVHGDNLEDIMKKDDLSYLIKQGYFKLAIVLSNRNRPGTIEKIEALDSCDLNKEVS